MTNVRILFLSDEQVPPGGVDVSGDDSDVEIVIMDSSDEDQSQEQVYFLQRIKKYFSPFRILLWKNSEFLSFSQFNVDFGDRKLNEV